jgi:hypothetical protein
VTYRQTGRRFIYHSIEDVPPRPHEVKQLLAGFAASIPVLVFVLLVYISQIR